MESDERLQNHVLQAIRAEAGISQEEMAERLETTQVSISRYELGTRQIPGHRALMVKAEFSAEMKRLGLTVEDLIRGEAE